MISDISQTHDVLNAKASISASLDVDRAVIRTSMIGEPESASDGDHAQSDDVFKGEAYHSDSTEVDTRALVASILSIEPDPKTGLLDFSKYLERDEHLAAGSFAEIYSGRWVGKASAKKKVLPRLVVKVSRAALMTDSEGRRRWWEKVVKNLEREISIWRSIRHPNLAPLIGTILGDHEASLPFLVSEFISYGTIVEYSAQCDMIRLCELISGFASGVSYLHEQNICHGNLNSHKVLVDERGIPKIIGFHLSRIIILTDSPFDDDDEYEYVRGPLRWMAPELLDDTQRTVTAKCDIYAFGITCWEILTGQIPYPECKNDAAVLMAVFVRNERPQKPVRGDLPGKIWDLIVACWDRDPSCRPAIKVVEQGLSELLTSETRALRRGTIEEHTDTLASVERALENDHPDTLVSVARPAETYGDRVSYPTQAERPMEKVAEKGELAGGKEHSDATPTPRTTSDFDTLQSKLDETNDLGFRVIEITKRMRGDTENHPETEAALKREVDDIWDRRNYAVMPAVTFDVSMNGDPLPKSHSHFRQQILVAKGALMHLNNREDAINEALRHHKLSEHCHVLAGFDESIVKQGVGLLEMIYMMSYVELPEPESVCTALGKVFSPYPGLIITPTKTYATEVIDPVDPADKSGWDMDALVSKRKISYNTRDYPPADLVVHYNDLGNHTMPGGWDPIDDGDNNEGNRGDDEVIEQRNNPDDNANLPKREGEEERHSSGDESDSQGSDPEPDPKKKVQSRKTPSAYFTCVGKLYDGPIIKDGKAFLKVRTTVDIESKATSKPRTIRTNFKKLRFQGSPQEASTFQQLVARVAVNFGERNTRVDVKHPDSTPAYEFTVKESEASRKGWGIALTGSGGWQGLHPSVLLALSGTYTNEKTRSTERNRHGSRVIQSEEDDYVEWIFHVDDPYDRERGLKLSRRTEGAPQRTDRLPNVEFEFVSADPPSHLKVEIDSFWTLLPAPPAPPWWKTARHHKSKLANLSVWIEAKIPSGLSEDASLFPDSCAINQQVTSSHSIAEASGVSLSSGLNDPATIRSSVQESDTPGEAEVRPTAGSSTGTRDIPSPQHASGSRKRPVTSTISRLREKPE